MNAAPAPQAAVLEPLELWLSAGAGPLRPQVLAALEPHGAVLRWAITAVEPAGRRLRIEAIVLRPASPRP